MPQAKYVQYLTQMYQEHADEFAAFRQIHDLYATDKRQYQDHYNEKGLPIQRIIEEWESRLCSQMESGHNSGYSSKLAEAFEKELRKITHLSTYRGKRT